jgi:hypothetical protein
MEKADERVLQALGGVHSGPTPAALVASLDDARHILGETQAYVIESRMHEIIDRLMIPRFGGLNTCGGASAGVLTVECDTAMLLSTLPCVHAGPGTLFGCLPRSRRSQALRSHVTFKTLRTRTHATTTISVTCPVFRCVSP